MTRWHELDGNMRAADGHYGVCNTCWDGQVVPKDEPEWECPDCGSMWYLEENEE